MWLAHHEYKLQRFSFFTFSPPVFGHQGVNPDVRYEVQYSSYVNVTSDGFVVLKRVVKTESFALQVAHTPAAVCHMMSHAPPPICCKLWTLCCVQLRAVDAATGEFGTAALSVQVIPGEVITLLTHYFPPHFSEVESYSSLFMHVTRF